MVKITLLVAACLFAASGIFTIFHIKSGTAKDGRIDELTAELGAAVSAYDNLLAKSATIAQQRDTLAAQISDSAQRIDDLTAEVRVLKHVSTEYATLQEAVGSLEDVEADIRELEALREPLIPDTNVGTFACTGSMEPRITCLDSATWLTDFDPAEITVGTVISFRTTPECSISSGNVAHRVIGIQDIDGELNFRTKGDNNWTDDGCWIPEDHVNAYMIELHEGTQMGNAALREQVNSARAAYDDAVAISTASLAAYRAYMTTFCPGDACPDERVSEADALYGEAHEYLAETHKVASAYVAALDKARGR